MNMLYRTFNEGESAPRFTLSLLSLGLLLGSAMPAAHAAKTELPADRQQGKPLPRAVLPGITLQSPKITQIGRASCRERV